MNLTETIIQAINEPEEPASELQEAPTITLKPLHKVAAGYDRPSSKFVLKIEPSIKFNTDNFEDETNKLKFKIEETQADILQINGTINNIFDEKNQLISDHIGTNGVDANQHQLMIELSKLDDKAVKMKHNIDTHNIFINAYSKEIYNLKEKHKAKQNEYYSELKENIDKDLLKKIEAAFKRAKDFHAALVELMKVNENAYYAAKKLQITDHNYYFLREKSTELIDNLNFRFRLINKHFGLNLDLQKYLDDLQDIQHDN